MGILIDGVENIVATGEEKKNYLPAFSPFPIIFSKAFSQKGC